MTELFDSTPCSNGNIDGQHQIDGDAKETVFLYQDESDAPSNASAY